MASEFEDYRHMRLHSNAYEYASAKADHEHDWCCPTCSGYAFRIGEHGIKCLFCSEQVELSQGEE